MFTYESIKVGSLNLSLSKQAYTNKGNSYVLTIHVENLTA